MNRFFCFFLFTLIISVSYGQGYDYRHFTPKEGLPSSEVYHVFQDSKGYIWIATDNGVSRYDGYAFKNYNVSNGLPDNTIFEIYEDWKGRIWFISFSAELSFLYNDSIQIYQFNKSLAEKLSHYPVSYKKSFYVDKENTVYFSDRHSGIIKVDNQGNAQLLDSRFFIYQVDSAPLINKGIVIPNDSISFFLKNKKWKTQIKIPRQSVHKTAAIHNGSLYFSYYNNLYRVNEGSCTQNCKFRNEIIWTSSQNSQLWIGTTKGAYCFEDGNLSSISKYHLLPNCSVSSVLIDNEGGVWLSTLESGVFYLPDLNLRSFRQESPIIIHQKITSLLEFNNKIWYGTLGGAIGVFNGKCLKQAFEISNLRVCASINDLKGTNTGKIIALTFCGSYIFPETIVCHEKFLDKDAYRLSINGGDKYIHANNDDVWTLSRSEVYKISEKTGAILKSIKIPKDIFVYSLLPLDDEILLIGTSHGLLKYNVTNNVLKYLTQIHPKLNDRILCLKKGNAGCIWVGTKTNGVFVIKNDTVIANLGKNEISSNYITSIFPYKNSVWLGTKGGGAYRVLIDNQQFSKFKIKKWTVTDGLLSNEVNDIIVNDTAALFATNEGLSVVYYTDYKENNLPSSIYVDKIKINNRDTSLLEEYILNYRKNSIVIKLTGIAYKQAGNIEYKYRLINKSTDVEWTKTTSREVRLAYLPHGDYIFQAKAINGGIESDNIISFKIVIKPPFWKTVWFYLLVIFIVSNSAYLLYLLRVREINKRNNLEKEFLINKNKLQQEIDKYRQQALTQQMNPHFIFNSLNSIQLFVYQNNKVLSSKYLSKFSKLVRLVLENSQIEKIPLQKELDALTFYLELEEMRLQGKMKFTIEVDETINMNFYMVPPLLIQPFVENAIWHGIVHKATNGLVKVVLKEQRDTFLCVVEDDGVGREKALEIQRKKKSYHTSLGAEITQKRLELLGRRYEKKVNINYIDLYENNTAIGTHVEIEIPKVTNED